MRWRRDIAEAVAGWAADPALAPLLRDGAALVWSPAPLRLVWAGTAAEPLAERLPLQADGALDPLVPAVARLEALAAGAAPRDGSRLERLRFARSALVPFATCACRRLSLASGEEVLLTAFVGPLPSIPRDRRAMPPRADAEPPVEAVPAPAPAPESPPAADPTAALRGRGRVRFVWQADAEGRFTSVSDALQEIVGSAGDILGRRWSDLADRVEDPDGRVAGHLARGETWSGLAVLWRIGGTPLAVPVDLAGLPVRDATGLAGFRGFGLLRTDEIRDWPGPAEPSAASAAPEPDPEAGRRVTVSDPPDVSAEAPGGDVALDAPSPEPVADGPAEPIAPLAANDDGEDRAAFSDLATRTGASFTPAWTVAAGAGEQAPAVHEPETDGLATDLASDDVAPVADPDPAEAPAPAEDQVQTPDAAAMPLAEVPAGRPRLVSTSTSAMSRLSTAERNAFREIARALGARFEGEDPGEADAELDAVAEAPPSARPAPAGLPAVEPSATQVLARLPLGAIVHRGEEIIHANRALLTLAGYEDEAALVADGGLSRLLRGRTGLLARSELETPQPVPLTTRGGESVAAEIRHAIVDWDDAPAGLMLVRPLPEADPVFRVRALEAELRTREGKVRELASILDTATDGVAVLDDVGRILSLNRSAEALFGFEQNEVAGEPFTVLLATESHLAALDYLEGLRANGVASVLNDGREVMGRVRQGGLIPLFMTMGRVSDARERKFCAVLRDITAFKKAEGELLAAKRAAEAASSQKTDFLATISHEIRTPLNAIIGFAEVMLEERFGPVGNERYVDYLRDIHASGAHVISLVNDLLDLAKIAAGRMELAFSSVSLNDLVASCVALMQPEAARSRIVLRTSFSGKLPPVLADERSVRQIVLNLLSNAVRFTDAGGQVIVSTALTDRGEIAFRVRDTGIGMSETEIEAALEPFRQLATARRGGGTGLGLPLTKALVEANRGTLAIASTKSEGTLVEVVFPPARVHAD